MTTMNISLLESLKDFVDERGYDTSSEYIRRAHTQGAGSLAVAQFVAGGYIVRTDEAG